SIKAVFWISPVTVARMGGSVERALGSLANLFWSLGAGISYGKSFLRVFVWCLAFLLLYVVLYLDNQAAPGFPQSVTTGLLFNFIAFSYRNDLKKYFPNGHGWIRSSLHLIGVFGILAAAVSVDYFRDFSVR